MIHVYLIPSNLSVADPSRDSRPCVIWPPPTFPASFCSSFSVSPSAPTNWLPFSSLSLACPCSPQGLRPWRFLCLRHWTRLLSSRSSSMRRVTPKSQLDCCFFEASFTVRLDKVSGDLHGKSCFFLPALITVRTCEFV